MKTTTRTRPAHSGAHKNQHTHTAVTSGTAVQHHRSIANGHRISSVNTCASSDVEVDVGAKEGDEDYCEELSYNSQKERGYVGRVSKFDNMPSPQGGRAGDWSASD